MAISKTTNIVVLKTPSGKQLKNQRLRSKIQKGQIKNQKEHKCTKQIQLMRLISRLSLLVKP